MTIPSPATPPRKNRGWLIYFLLLFLMAGLATVVLIVYNLRQQLKPEQLESARKIWKEKGPGDYEMSFTRRIGESDQPDQFYVRVKFHRPIEVTHNGRALAADQFHHYGMERFYDDIERFLEIDAQKGKPKTYTRAIFDDQTGALRWYVRRVMGSRERVEITVEPLKTP